MPVALKSPEPRAIHNLFSASPTMPPPRRLGGRRPRPRQRPATVVTRYPGRPGGGRREIPGPVDPTLLVVALTVAGCAGDGWITLNEGEKGLENWNRIGDANWRPEGGAIMADRGKGGFLVSKNSDKEFVIRAEF